MPELTILTFLFDDLPRKWRELGYAPYNARYVNALYRACKDRVKVPHRFVCVTNKPQGIECETMPCWPKIELNGHDSCYLRLRAFDTEFQKSLGTPYVALLDLDVVLVDDCTDIFRWAMERDFAVLKGSHYPNGDLCSYYNGGFWVCKVGARQKFWDTIQRPNAAERKAKAKMPSGRPVLGSDQGWMTIVSGDSEDKITPDLGAIQARYGITKGAKMVFFAGKNKPWDRNTKSSMPKVYEEWRRFADDETKPGELIILSWKWEGPRTFLPEYVNTHQEMVSQNLKQPHRYVCITDDPAGLNCETFPLWGDCDKMVNPTGSHLPSCYRRLKIFDPDTMKDMGIREGARVVSLDLDVVLTGQIDPLLDRDEDFVGWKVPGGRHRFVLNGTMFMHRAGTMPHLWEDFCPKRSPKLAKSAGYFGTDQAWMSYKLCPDVAGWTRRDGVIGYSSDVRLTGKLPKHARVVSFHGGRKPWDPNVRNRAPWIKKHWRMSDASP